MESYYRNKYFILLRSILIEHDKIADFYNINENFIDTIIKKIEIYCHNAHIDKCIEHNIPLYWDNKIFIEKYSNLMYNIAINLDPQSSVNKAQPDHIKYYFINRLYEYIIYKYLKYYFISCN